MQFIGMFAERLGSYRRDILAITAVLAVGVDPSIASRWKSSYFGPYLVPALQNGLLI